MIKGVFRLFSRLVLAGAGGGYVYFAFLWLRASENPVGRIVLITDLFGENLVEMVIFGFFGVFLIAYALWDFKKEIDEAMKDEKDK